MSDPRKFFRCKSGHTVNDMLFPWGKQSECPVCVQEKARLSIREQCEAEYQRERLKSNGD